jgi:hypothetical protein
MSDDRKADHKKVSIRFNGKEVADPAELPPDVRKLIENAEESLARAPAWPPTAGGAKGSEVRFEATRERYEIDGKTYENIEEVPPELRKEIADAMGAPGEGAERVIVETKTYGSLDAMPPELRASAVSMLGHQGAKPHSSSTVAALAPVLTAPPEEVRSTRPRPVGPSWPIILISALAGALLMYLFLRR